MTGGLFYDHSRLFVASCDHIIYILLHLSNFLSPSVFRLLISSRLQLSLLSVSYVHLHLIPRIKTNSHLLLLSLSFILYLCTFPQIPHHHQHTKRAFHLTVGYQDLGVSVRSLGCLKVQPVDW